MSGKWIAGGETIVYTNLFEGVTVCSDCKWTAVNETNEQKALEASAQTPEGRKAYELQLVQTLSASMTPNHSDVSTVGTASEASAYTPDDEVAWQASAQTPEDDEDASNFEEQLDQALIASLTPNHNDALFEMQYAQAMKASMKTNDDDDAL